MAVLDVKEGFELVRGTKESFSLSLGELPNGQPILLPVFTVCGREDGPTVFVNACMHGDETLGADVVRRVIHDLDPAQMRGNVLAIPVANMPGQATRTRRNVMEMYPGPHDMNRIFPAPADGVLSERLAATIDSRFSAIADYVFDLHCASVGGSWQPYSTIPPRDACSDAETWQKMRDFAIAFGAPLVLVDYLFPGSLVAPVLKRGGIASMAEFGVANHADPADRTFGIDGVERLLHHVGIIEKDVSEVGAPLEITGFARVKADRGGYLELAVAIGDDVVQGDLIGVVENLDREVVEEFHAPSAGRVCRLNTMGVVGTGDNIAFIGEHA